VIAVSGVAAYSNSFSGLFVYDDLTALVRNPAMRVLWPLSKALNAPRDTTLAGRPVASLTFAVNYAMAPEDAKEAFAPTASVPDVSRQFERNAWGYHAANLGIHLLAALCLFGVVRRTLRAPRVADAFTPSAAHWIAMTAATIWVVHPLTTGAVTYLVQRVESLMGLFYLATIYCAMRAASLAQSAADLRAEPSPASSEWSPGSSRLAGGEIREQSEWSPARAERSPDSSGSAGSGNRDHSAWSPGSSGPGAVPLLLWTGAAVLACLLGMGTKEVMVTAPLMVVAWDYLFLEGPWRDTLRGRWPLYLSLAATWIPLAWIVSLAPRAASVGIGLHGVAWWSYLATQSGVLLHYLRLVVVPWPLCLDYEWPISASMMDVAVPGLFIVSAFALTAWAFIRRSAWSLAGVAFFLVLAPTSSVVPIVTEVASEQRMYLPLAGIIAVMVAGAWRAARRLIGGRSPSPIPAVALVTCLAFGVVAGLGSLTYARNGDYQNEERLYRRTIEVRPSNSRARNNLGTILIRQGRASEAEPPLREAIRLNPGYPEAHANLGVSLAVQGRATDALPFFARAVALEPGYGDAWRNYGEALATLGRFREAIPAYQKALESYPDDVRLLSTVAWILATAPDANIRNGTLAIDLAGRAMALSNGSSPDVLDTLAAAYAEAGRFSDAVSTGERALALAQGRQDLAPAVEFRLGLYRSGQAFHPR